MTRTDVDPVSPHLHGPAGRRATVRIVVAALCAELLAVSLLYHHGFDFECRAVGSEWFCGGLSAAVVRALVVGGVAALLVALRPRLLATMRAGLRSSLELRWAAAQIVGFAMVLSPRAFLEDGLGEAVFLFASALWIGGALLAVLGAMLTVAPAAVWLKAAGVAGGGAAMALTIAAFAPEMADAAQRLWEWSPITAATFHASSAALTALGERVVAEPATVTLVVSDFAVLVGRQCSGVEGMALITGFLGFYIHLNRDRLHISRALALLPVAILASWLLNVLRIVALMLIGAHVSPELAVDGFHSHAGWLMFTVLALGIVATVHSLPWLRRDALAPVTPRRAVPPLREDWNAARLLPFIILMATGLLASTFLQTPALGYPLRFVAMATAVALFLPLYRAMSWRLDPVSVLAGVAVGALWVATQRLPDADTQVLRDALDAAPVWFAALWMVTRVLGTTVLVPLIEELLFRDYILRRVAEVGGIAGPVLGVLVSTVLFAALHDRWLAAGLAGLVFAALALRGGRTADAIVAHAVANGLIAGWAAATGAWHVI